MTRTLLGGLLVAVGAVVVLLAALADQIGLGAEGSSFGWKQIVGVVVGATIVVVGAIVFLRGRPEGDTETATEPPATTERTAHEHCLIPSPSPVALGGESAVP